ncbi:MAG: cadmium-translocating P-type ATPase, partial [Ruminococcus sp.]|nr:cadmium-translocating P-type ATPase [Ruminococcus sp.]
MEKDYSILNLDCANCGAKIEEAISRLEGVEMAILNFPLKKIKVIGDISDDMLKKMNETASQIEPGVEIVPVAEKKTRQFEIKNLDCAHCGAKIEEAISQLDGVDSALLNYPLKKLKVTGVITEELITLMNRTADSIEPGVEITPYSSRESQRRSRIKEIVKELEEEAPHTHSHEEHEHGEHCDCGHEHHDHDEHEHHSHSATSDGYEEFEITLGTHSHGEHEYHGKHEAVQENFEDKEIVDEYKEILGDMYNDEPVHIKKRAVPAEDIPVGKHEMIHDEHEHEHTHEHEEDEIIPKPAAHEKEPDLVSELVSENDMQSVKEDSQPAVETVTETFADLHEDTEEKSDRVPVSLLGLILGAEAFIAALICDKIVGTMPVAIVLYIIAYLLLGINVLKATVRNIKAKNFFNENLLMTIATIGAFALGEYPEAVGVMLFFRIGELFEDYAVNKSRKAITAVSELKVEEADVLVDGEFVRIPADEINKGDIIRIKVGERIAADGIVESGKSRIDTSAVNGEPVPVTVRAGDKILSGCINLTEGITIRTTASADESMIAKIAEAVEDASASKPKIDRFITRFAKVYTPIVIAIALLTAIIPSIITGDWHKWIYAALTFLVISCPCALVLSVPLAYFSGIGAASKLGILFKGGNSIEALAKVKAIAFDKTGTLTNGTFTVTQVQTFGVLSNRHILRICGSCEIASTHPVAESIVAYCKKNKLKLGTPEKIQEIPGRGIEAEVSGRTVLCGNEKMMHEYNVPIPKGQPADGGSVVYVAVNGKAEGRIVVADTIKKSAAEAMKELNAMGIHTAMLTGDKNENARIAGKKIGVEIVKGELLPEDKLHAIEDMRSVYGPVMFVGDGINDGPVLAGADVGGAMQTGSHLALEAADAVFMNPEPAAVVNSK